ncbi:hypothetical protein LCGC14_1018170 [marine sediment metagenome]|uniref:Uncharacterized protein n=1 Tax=marine sediment metagenome TaxID=412755 RepID=A0A0F9MY94_9ZZZZ
MQWDAWGWPRPQSERKDDAECTGCGEIFPESELTSGACAPCWDNTTRDEDD